MFKLIVVICLCIIAFKSCADTSLFLVNVPLSGSHYAALLSGTDIYTVRLPVALTDSPLTQVW